MLSHAHKPFENSFRWSQYSPRPMLPMLAQHKQAAVIQWSLCDYMYGPLLAPILSQQNFAMCRQFSRWYSTNVFSVLKSSQCNSYVIGTDLADGDVSNTISIPLYRRLIIMDCICLPHIVLHICCFTSLGWKFLCLILRASPAKALWQLDWSQVHGCVIGWWFKMCSAICTASLKPFFHFIFHIWVRCTQS